MLIHCTVTVREWCLPITVQPTSFIWSSHKLLGIRLRVFRSQPLLSSYSCFSRRLLSATKPCPLFRGCLICRIPRLFWCQSAWSYSDVDGLWLTTDVIVMFSLSDWFTVDVDMVDVDRLKASMLTCNWWHTFKSVSCMNHGITNKTVGKPFNIKISLTIIIFKNWGIPGLPWSWQWRLPPLHQFSQVTPQITDVIYCEGLLQEFILPAQYSSRRPLQLASSYISFTRTHPS